MIVDHAYHNWLFWFSTNDFNHNLSSIYRVEQDMTYLKLIKQTIHKTNKIIYIYIYIYIP